MEFLTLNLNIARITSKTASPKTEILETCWQIQAISNAALSEADAYLILQDTE